MNAKNISEKYRHHVTYRNETMTIFPAECGGSLNVDIKMVFFFGVYSEIGQVKAAP